MSQNRQALGYHHGEERDPRLPIVGLAQERPGLHRHPWHSHFRAQFVFAISGVMTVSAEPGTWVVPPQQAVWLPPGVHHAVHTAGTVSERFLYVHPEAAVDLPKVCRVVSVPPLLRELVLKATAIPVPYPPEGPEARLMRVILDELRLLQPEPLFLPLPQDKRLQLITEALSRDPADGRPLGAWAKTAGASERTLARLFIKEMGMTFGAWRQRLRLLSAVSRLAQGAAVTTVALDLGYESPSAFIAMFKRRLGQTPGHYMTLAGRAHPGT